MVTKNQHGWRLLAPMACVALDTDTEEPLFRHLIHRTMLASCLSVIQLITARASESAWNISEAFTIKPGRVRQIRTVR